MRPSGKTIQDEENGKDGKEVVMDEQTKENEHSFCSNCGKELKGRYRFCPGCGAEIISAAPEAESKEAANAAPEAESKEAANAAQEVESKDATQAASVEEYKQVTPKKNGKVGLILLIVVVLLAILGIGLYILLGGPIFKQKVRQSVKADAPATKKETEKSEKEPEVIKAKDVASGIDPLEWRAAYASFLENHCREDDFEIFGRRYKAGLLYIDGDDVPELVIQTQEKSKRSLAVYYYKGGAVKTGVSFEVTQSSIYNDLPNVVYYYPKSDCVVKAYCYDAAGRELDYETEKNPAACNLLYYSKDGKEIGSYQCSKLARGSYYETGERLSFEVEKVRLDGLSDPGALKASLGLNFETEKGQADLGELKKAAIGDFVLFGSYDQDGVAGNGNETIEWQVLDKRDGKMLLLSKYVLDIAFFEYDPSSTPESQQEAVREKLNGSFYASAFNDEERKYVVPVVNTYSDVIREPYLVEENGYHILRDKTYYDEAEATQKEDYVFLLSGQEVEQYLGVDCLTAIYDSNSRELTQILCYPTASVATWVNQIISENEYANLQVVNRGGKEPSGANVYQNQAFDYSCSWILRSGFRVRSSGTGWMQLPFITANNYAGGFGVATYEVACYGLRPAIWVNVE